MTDQSAVSDPAVADRVAAELERYQRGSVRRWRRDALHSVDRAIALTEGWLERHTDGRVRLTADGRLKVWAWQERQRQPRLDMIRAAMALAEADRQAAVNRRRPRAKRVEDIDPATPETRAHVRALRRMGGSTIAELSRAGSLTFPQTRAWLEIQGTYTAIGGTVGMRTASLETRIDVSRFGRHDTVSAAWIDRSDAYSQWRRTLKRRRIARPPQRPSRRKKDPRQQTRRKAKPGRRWTAFDVVWPIIIEGEGINTASLRLGLDKRTIMATLRRELARYAHIRGSDFA